MRCLFLIALFLLLFPAGVSAHPVISEVLWAGSDLSTMDEWLEIANPDEDDIDLSGWTITSLSSNGQEVLTFRFATGSVIASEEFLVIARRAAASSRLLAEPAFLAPSASLLNTALLLRLRDASGLLVDEVDDGSGAPFAGANPSGSGSKASMERIDLLAPGNLKENWRTATESIGFDQGAKVLATPGIGSEVQNSSASSSFAPSGTSEDRSDSSASSVSSSSPIPFSSSSSVCSDPLEVGIFIQSGTPEGVGKVTINLQAVALAGLLNSSACSWFYGDGFTSQSCNPPVHSFTVAGIYNVRLEAKNQCGNTLVQELSVQVHADGISGGQTTQYFDGSRLYLRSALPNPEGADTGHEWVEIRNPEEKPVDLAGWKLRVGKNPARWHALKGSIAPRSSLRIYDTEISLKLPNSESEIVLMNPAAQEASVIEWQAASEGREYYPVDLRNTQARGRLVQVIGSTTFELALEGEAVGIHGEESVFVRLLGIQPADTESVESIENNYGILRALTEGQIIELEFDTEMWDERGRLLAYVYTDQQYSLQEQLLVTGYWMVDRENSYAMKNIFLDRESPFVRAKLVADVLPKTTVFAKEDSSEIAPKKWSGSIMISEVFSSPDPKLKSADNFLGKEWIELSTESRVPVILSGVILEIGKKKKALPEGLFIDSESPIIVSMDLLRLSLKNDGAAIVLRAPDGSLLDTLQYPKLKYGQSFLRFEDTTCISLPTPGMANSCVQTGVSAKKSSASSKTISPAVAKYAAFYRAQTDADVPMESVFFASKSDDLSWPVLLLAFGLGGSFSALLILFALRRGLLRI